MVERCKCEYCGGTLVEIGMMCSGNSRYMNYECQECYKETSRCIGLLERSQQRFS